MCVNLLLKTTKVHRQLNKIFIFIFFIILFSSISFAQEVYHGCGMDGSARSKKVKDLNELKNRFNFPEAKDFDKNVTLKAMLLPGNDLKRWNYHKAAEITGYIYNVKPGGIESCNCEAKNLLYRDTHIELILNPNETAETKRVIVEVTPRIRAIMEKKGINWTTQALRKNFLGKWVKVQGWLMFDAEHAKQSGNTNPENTKDWRATAWEIHPVTNIEIVTKH